MDESRQTDTAAASEPEEARAERPSARTPHGSHPTPLFLRDRSDGMKGDAQDEKDETGE